MTKLYHPTLAGVVREVEKNVEAWVKAGWRKSEPKADATLPTRARVTKKAAPSPRKPRAKKAAKPSAEASE